MKQGLALKALLGVKISKKEIKKFYNENQASFEKKAEIKASHILFKAKTDDEVALAEAKKRQ